MLMIMSSSRRKAPDPAVAFDVVVGGSATTALHCDS